MPIRNGARRVRLMGGDGSAGTACCAPTEMTWAGRIGWGVRLRSQKSRRDAGATKDEPPTSVEARLRHSGRSMVRPYGNDLGGADRLRCAFEEVKRPGPSRSTLGESLGDSRDSAGATKAEPVGTKGTGRYCAVGTTPARKTVSTRSLEARGGATLNRTSWPGLSFAISRR
jgi:hypothetical protein